LLPSAVLALFLAVPAFAIDFRSETSFVLPAGETVDREIWLMASEVRVEGTLLQDSFIFGVSNLLSGTARSDLWAAGEDVRVSGTAGDDLRVAGRSVVVEGRTQGNLMAAGESLHLTAEAEVLGDVTLAGETIVLQGTLARGLEAVGKQVTLGGVVNGDVRIAATDIAVLKGTRIEGNLEYLSVKELFLDDSVHVGGKLIRRSLQPAERAWSDVLVWQCYLFLAALLVGMAMLAVFPDWTGRSVRCLRQATWRCGLVGVISFCLLPVVSGLLVVTLIGIPLGLLLGGAFAGLVYLSKIVVALSLGGAILRRRGPQSYARAFGVLVVGLVLIYGCGMLPMIQSALWLLMAFYGMGALLLGLWAGGRRGHPASSGG